MRTLSWAFLIGLLASSAQAGWSLGFITDESLDRGWATAGKELVEFRLSDRTELRRIPLPLTPQTLQRTRDGLLITASDNSVHHLTLPDAKARRIAVVKHPFASTVHADGDRVALIEADGRLRIRGIDDGHLRCETEAFTLGPLPVVSRWTGSKLIVTDGTGLVRAFSWRKCSSRTPPKYPAKALWIAPSGKLALRFGSGGVELFELADGTSMGTLPGSQRMMPVQVEWRGDDLMMQLLSGDSAGTAKPSVRAVWWRTQSDTERSAITNGQRVILDRLLDGPAALIEGGLLEAAKGRARLWPEPTEARATAVPPISDTGRITSMKFHPVGHMLATVGAGGVSLWDVAARAMVGRLPIAACAVDFTWGGAGMVALGGSGASLYRVPDLSLVSMRTPSKGAVVAGFCRATAKVDPADSLLVVPRGPALQPLIEIRLASAAPEHINRNGTVLADMAFSLNSRWVAYQVGAEMHCVERRKDGRRWTVKAPSTLPWLGVSDEGRVVSIGMTGQLDVLDGRRSVRLRAPDSAGTPWSPASVAFAGEAFFARGLDALYRWDLTAPEKPPTRIALPTAVLTEQRSFSSALAVRPDGKVAAVAIGSGVELIDLQRGRSMGALRAGREGHQILRREDGALWVTTSEGTTAWHFTPPEIRRPIELGVYGHRRTPTVDPKGRWVATPGEPATLRIGQDAERMLSKLGPLWYLAATADGETLVAAAPKGLLAIDPASGAARWRVSIKGQPIGVSVHDGLIVVMTRPPPGKTHQLVAHSLADGRALWAVDGPKYENFAADPVVAVGDWGVVSSSPAGIMRWTKAGKALPPIALPLNDIPASLLRLDAKRLVVGTVFGTVYEVDVASGRLLSGLRLTDSRIVSIAPGLDEKGLAALDTAGQVHLARWNASGELRPSARLLGVGQRDFVIETASAHWSSPGAARQLAWRTAGKASDPLEADLRGNQPATVLRELGVDGAWIEAYEALLDRRQRRLKSGSTTAGCPERPNPVWWAQPPPLSLPVGRHTLGVRLDKPCAAARLQTYVDGVLVGDVPAADAKASIDIDVIAGENLVEVFIVDGPHRSVPARVSVQGIGQTTRRLFALTIGVSNYRDTRRNLRFAAKDAEAMAASLKRLDGYDSVHTRVLTNEKATAQSIRKARDFLAQARVGDTVILFLSGHGVLTDDDAYVYATHETDFDHSAPNGLRYAEIVGLFDGVAARRRMLWMDTCHAGEIDPGTQAQATRRPASDAPDRSGRKGLSLDPEEATLPRLLLELEFADLRRGAGIEVFSSSLGGQSSYEDEAWAHGAFTRAILRGLDTLDADADADGRVLLSELVPFVRQTVQQMTANRQTPVARRDVLGTDPVFVDRAQLIASLKTFSTDRTPIRLAASSPKGDFTLVHRRGQGQILVHRKSAPGLPRVATLPNGCTEPRVIAWPKEALAQLDGTGCGGTSLGIASQEVVVKRNIDRVFEGEHPTVPRGFGGLTLGMSRAAALNIYPTLKDTPYLKPAEFHGATHWVDFDEDSQVIDAFRVTVSGTSARGLVRDAWGSGVRARADFGDEGLYWFASESGLRATLTQTAFGDTSVSFTAYWPTARLIGTATALLGRSAEDVATRYMGWLPKDELATLRDPAKWAGGLVSLRLPPTEFGSISAHLHLSFDPKGVVERTSISLSYDSFADLKPARLALLKETLGGPDVVETTDHGHIVFEQGERRVEVYDQEADKSWDVTVTSKSK